MKANVLFALLTVCLAAGLLAGCDRGPDQSGSDDVERQEAKLLSFAFEVASAIPTQPHEKDRAKMQQAVVDACLAVDRPARAAEYARKIDNWRRGVAFGDLAFYMAGRGDRDMAESYMELASRTAVHYRGWRKDRIKVRIARTRAVLGDIEGAEELTRDVDQSEAGRLEGVKKTSESDEAFQQKLTEMKAHIAKGNFDITRNALASVGELYAREYSNRTRRAALMGIIEASYRKLPVIVQIDLLADLVQSAIDHGDREAALGLVDRATEIADSVTWRRLFYGLGVKARLAKLRYLAGDEGEACKRLEAVLATYRLKRQSIPGMRRAETLRGVAEAYATMGRSETALEIYRLAVEDGSENPNARVRALDLSATCCSMAIYGIAPNAQLWARIKEIRGGLRDPW